MRHALVTLLVFASLTGATAVALAQPGAIRTKCAAEWPTDFAMRVYCEKKQTEAAAKLNVRKMTSGDERLIRAKCIADWPADYAMRDYCELKQLAALQMLAPLRKPERRMAAGEPTAATLLDKTESEIRLLIGEPKEIAAARWSFTTEEDGEEADLKVYFDKGKVNDVRPSDVAISAVKRRKDPPTVASGEPAKPPAPKDAVARCGNGAYVYVSTGENTCKGFGGVSEWFKKP